MNIQPITDFLEEYQIFKYLYIQLQDNTLIRAELRNVRHAYMDDNLLVIEDACVGGEQRDCLMVDTTTIFLLWADNK